MDNVQKHICPGRVKNCLHVVQTVSGAHPDSYQMGNGAVSPEVKRPGREADHSPPASAEVKKMWNHTSIRVHGVVLN
jgi:hypothetical protein